MLLWDVTTGCEGVKPSLEIYRRDPTGGVQPRRPTALQQPSEPGQSGFGTWIPAANWSPFAGHRRRSGVSHSAPTADGLAAAEFEGTVRLWDVATTSELLVLRGHTREVEAVVFSPDGRRLASAGGDRSVRLWDSAHDPDVLTIRCGSAAAGRKVVFSPDGRQLASAGYGTIQFWDVGSGKQEMLLRPGDIRPGQVAFSPDGRRLAAAERGGTVNIWDIATARVNLNFGLKDAKVDEASRPIPYVVFSPDGLRLAAASGKTVRLWGPPYGTRDSHFPPE